MTAAGARGRFRFGATASAAAALALAALCAVARASAPGEGGLLSRLLAGGPWVLAEPARSFSPDTLYEEIDGEAELFLPYGFRRLEVAVVSRTERPGARIRLELFLQGSPADAYGIYTQHRFPDQELSAVGPSEAIVSDASVDFFRGDTFVRIRGTSGGATRRDLIDLARDVSSLLPGEAFLPAEAEALRIVGLVPGTVVYQKRAILGYEVLAPGFEAKYSAGAVSCVLVLIPASGAGTQPASLERFAAALPGFSRLEGGLARAGLPSGNLWLIAADGHLAGVAGAVSREQAGPILEALRRNLGTPRK